MTSVLTPAAEPAVYNAAADLVERNLAGARDRILRSSTTIGTPTYGELAAQRRRLPRARSPRSACTPSSASSLALLDTVDFPIAVSRRDQSGIVPIPITRSSPPPITPISSPTAAPPRSSSRSSCCRNLLEAVAAAGWTGHAHRLRPGRTRCTSAISPALRAVAARRATARSSVPDASGRTVLLAVFVRFDRQAEGRRARADEHDADRRAVRASRPGFQSRTTSCTRRRSCSSPTVSGTRCRFRWRRARRACCAPGASRPTSSAACFASTQPTIFCGVPTLFGALSRHAGTAARAASTRCASARRRAKRCPKSIGRRWTEQTGVEIIDGIGSTEMLHIFVSNRPGDVVYGTTGNAGPRLSRRA